MTDTLELLQGQKQSMEAERAKIDADIRDLDTAIKAIKSRRGDAAPKSKPGRKKRMVRKAQPAKAPAAKATPTAKTAVKPASKSAAKPAPKAAVKSPAKAAAKPVAKTADKPKKKVTLDDAIIKAVGSGQSTPVMILDHVTKKMAVDTTINSIRTRVSRLKREGKLLRGKEGWSLPAA